MMARLLVAGRSWWVVAAWCGVVLLGPVARVRATTFTVSNANDSGSGSLRAAIVAANANAGADQISFTSGATGTIALASTLDVTDDLNIAGPGARTLTLSGGNARRIMAITAPVTITGLRFANGFSDRGAGLTFDDPGLLTVRDCHFDQNLATVDGGAILVFQGSLNVRRTTFTTCQAAGNGGVIWYGQGGGTPTATITNCTFVNNFASTAGGAIRQFSTTAYTAAVANCTFVVNNAGNNGGAIALAGGTMSLLNNLFTANGAGGNPGAHLREAAGSFTSLGHNLFGDLGGTTFTPAVSDRAGAVGAQLNTGILIAFPFNNGGATDTLPFVNATSIAIDAGGITGAPSSDQRDFPRIGCAPDIGAFEFQTLVDTDVDGVINCLDTCPSTPTCASVDQNGCPTDSDDDGVFDGCDACPGTRLQSVDANGCSTADVDDDGVLDDVDLCRGTQACAKEHVDGDGCPTDADLDGVFDGCDQCPGEDDFGDTNSDGLPDCIVPTTTTTVTTSTTTTAPECTTNTDCDDGAACTTDTCDAGTCGHLGAAGLDGANCLLSEALATPLCSADTIATAFNRFAISKLQRARANVRKAAAATKPKAQQRFTQKARDALGKILTRNPGTTSDACRQHVTAVVNEVLGVLGAAPTLSAR